MPGEKRPLITDKNPTQEVGWLKFQIKGIVNDIVRVLGWHARRGFKQIVVWISS